MDILPSGSNTLSQFLTALETHLTRIKGLSHEVGSFVDRFLTEELRARLAALAVEKMSLTLADAKEHSFAFKAAPTAFDVCTIPVAISDARFWFGHQHGGYVRLLEQVCERLARTAPDCPVLCQITFGCTSEGSWVNLALVPLAVNPHLKCRVMPLDLMTDEEKRNAGYEAQNTSALDESGLLTDYTGRKMPYITAPAPEGDGLCSDNACPCPPPGTRIPRGGGFLYVSPEMVDFRKDAISDQERDRKMEWFRESMRQQHGVDDIFLDPSIYGPILVCRKGAELRNLDLDVAAADAKRWWETGRVPLRATPLKKKGSKKKGVWGKWLPR